MDSLDVHRMGANNFTDAEAELLRGVTVRTRYYRPGQYAKSLIGKVTDIIPYHGGLYALVDFLPQCSATFDKKKFQRELEIIPILSTQESRD